MAFNSELSEVKIIFSEATPLSVYGAPYRYNNCYIENTENECLKSLCIPQILLSSTLYTCHCPILIQRLITIKNKSGGERDGSAIKSTFNSYRESGFNFK